MSLDPRALSLAFSAAVLASLLVKFWLATRQMRHVAQHRDTVPAAFADRVSPQAHRKSADYALARQRHAIVAAAWSSALVVGWTLLGGLAWLDAGVHAALGTHGGPMVTQLVLVGAFLLAGALLDLPFELHEHFVLEARFGFNKLTPAQFLKDAALSFGLALLIGTPLLALLLWIMQATGARWWLWAWGALTAFQLLAMVVFPIWIAPLFNKFEPLADEALVARVQALMQRCGLRARGFFVMDGSRRSAHSNAYFTGLGRGKRVVFYDTLLARLSGTEVEAVLAHELGHFRLHHLPKRLLPMLGVSLAGFALLGWLKSQPGFYLGLGVMPSLAAPNDALALLLFMLALPPFLYFVSPLFAGVSRRHEYEADAYARTQADAADLARALLKLHEDNAATLTPDPLFVRFYYSHPPASERLARLETAPA